MLPKTNNQTNEATGSRADSHSLQTDRPNLSHRYGVIGIQAVAAAARYSNVRSDKPAGALRIDLRFVESAV